MGLHWFHALAVGKSAVTNRDGKMPLWCADLDSFRFIHRGGVAGSYGNSTFSFLKLHTDFHRIHCNLHTHSECLYTS